MFDPSLEVFRVVEEAAIASARATVVLSVIRKRSFLSFGRL